MPDEAMPRARYAPTYVVATAIAAPLVLALGWWLSPPRAESLPVLLVLLALGAASARLRDVEGEAQVDLSFTAAILLAAVPVGGPGGAGALGALVPLLDLRRGRGIAAVFNSAMTCLVGSASGLAYLAFGGQVPVPHDATGRELLLGVGAPLVAADVALCLVNVALVAGMIWLHSAPGARLELDPFLATLPVYLGYAVTAFLFVVLWGPGGLYGLAAAFVVAPLLVARWAYVQYIAETRARQHILEALAAAGDTRDWSALRSRRIDSVLRVFEAHLGLPRRVANALRYGAALHDIGIVAFPRSMMQRAAHELSDDEIRTLRAHAVTGYETIRDIGFLEEAAQAVRHHHERWDGTGYPDGLAGQAIPLPARILAIVDAFEALAWPQDETEPVARAQALAQIRARAGRDFDPSLVAGFEQALAADPGPLQVPLESAPASPSRPAAPPAADAAAASAGTAARPPLRHAAPEVGDVIAAAQRRGVGGRPAPAPRPVLEPPAAGPRSVGAPGHPAARARRTPARLVRSRSSASASDAQPGTIGLRWLLLLIVVLFVAVLALRGDAPRAADAHRTVLLVYLATLVVAERFRIRMLWRIETAPTATAAGIALALFVGVPGSAAVAVPTWEVVAVVVAAQLIDYVTMRRRAPLPARREVLYDAALRTMSVLVISVVMRDLPGPSGPLGPSLAMWPQWLQALVLLIVVGVVLLLEAPLRAWPRARAERSGLVREAVEEVRGGLGLGAAVAATGVLITMAEQVLGLVAVPLLLLPLAISQLAFRRYAHTRAAYRESVRALSRLPELAGLVPSGHAARVAELAVAVAVRLGMPERDVVDLEYAAMLHDLGQLALLRPLPQGATVLAAAADQQRIARSGAQIVEQTGTLQSVADIVRHQAVPYHHVLGRRAHQPLASRIVKVANAYEDYRAGAVRDADRLAIERLYLGLGHEFDPKVVRACEAHVFGPATAPAEPAAGAPWFGAGDDAHAHRPRDARASGRTL